MPSGERPQPLTELIERPEGDTWVALVDGPLPMQQVSDWAVHASCGAVVTFSGTVRNHSPGRRGVTALTYEAYEEYATARLRAIAQQARAWWPDVGRLVALHRVGFVPVAESAVVVAVTAPHRDQAFEAARFLIDTIKETVPLWKKEHWPGGEAWAEPCESHAGQNRPAVPSGALP